KCQWLGQGSFSSGLIASADPAALRGKPWAKLVFSPMQFPYQEGIWRGPLIVLVDGGTASAAEQFVAVLQDNQAAVILGAPTLGGGGVGSTCRCAATGRCPTPERITSLASLAP